MHFKHSSGLHGRPACHGSRVRVLQVYSVIAAPPSRSPPPPSSTPTPGAQPSGWRGFLPFAWPPAGGTTQHKPPVPPQAREDVRPQAPLDVSRFLTAPSDHELKYMRRMASLSALTYHMDKLTPRALQRRHGVELVTTSLSCERLTYEHSKTAKETLEEGDGMAPGLHDVQSRYSELQTAGEVTSSPRSGPASNIVMFQPLGAGLATAAEKHAGEHGTGTSSSSSSSGLAYSEVEALPPATVGADGRPSLPLFTVMQQPQQQQQQRAWSPADLVAAKLSEAAAFASTAALQPLASAAGSIMTTSVGLVSSALAPALAAPPVPAAIGDRVAAAAIARVASAEVASSPHNTAEVKAASTSTVACPSEWFVVDDARSATRTFVVQGSDSLDHWKTNITFDPVVFEDMELGVKVHRGAYEAALALYDRFLPLVQEHVDSSPFAKVCFTGHSIGGSLATLLMLMYVWRGVLPPTAVAPTYTFGTPAILCLGAHGPCGCGGACSEDSSGGCSTAGEGPVCSVHNALNPAAGAAHVGGLLSVLGLREDAVRNVVMSRDIVPRAFTCDYTIVADILKSWGASFREHCCLGVPGRKHMYAFIGQLFVLQPSATLRFVREPALTLLPPEPELYLMSHPSLQSSMRSASARSAALREGRALAREPASLTEAVWELMDRPHPLDILADAGSYGDSGAISRYHNPDNYCRALGRVLADRRDGAQRRLTAPSAVPCLAHAPQGCGTD